ncbi:hypothetical protein PMI37_04327 [Pseudomonas sp. GM80]|nr:hypothetical protein PMI37_04327 [Pseudomonas sp. GM80]
MSYLQCVCLILASSGVVGHRLQKTTNRLLVKRRDAPVLPNQLFLFWRKQYAERRGTSARQHKCSIYSALFKCRHIAKIERISLQFIVFLSSPAHTK